MYLEPKWLRYNFVFQKNRSSIDNAPPSRKFPHRQQNFFRLCDPLGGMLLCGRGPICQPRHRTEKCRLGSKPRDISNSQPIGMKWVKKMRAMGVEPGQKGLRDRNSPMCTLSQNGYGAILSSRKTDPALTPVFLFTHQSLLLNAPPLPHISPPTTKLPQTVRSSWGNAPARSGPDLPAPAPD